MIRFFKVGFIFIMSITIFSCSKSSPTPVIPVIPYADQYPVDIAAIETYLKTHSITVTNLPEDQDATFATVVAGDASSIWGSNPNIPKASLLNKIVNSNGVDYKVYYISLRDGTNERPTRVDSAFVSYKGKLLDETVFDQAQNPVWFSLGNVIQGWKEIIPFFKSGSVDATNTNGTVSYANFGAGVMFLPSGLAYYNGSVGSIPAYSPLIFSFKLKNINYVDNDYDRIDSKNEDVNGDGDPTNDDSDGDGHPDFIDIDDDADGIPTKTEIRRPERDPVTGNIMLDSSNQPIYLGYYPYNGAATDDLSTPYIDERQGIPTGGISPDYTSPNRLRIHLDKNYH